MGDNQYTDLARNPHGRSVYNKRTYSLPAGLGERLTELATSLGVGVSDLVSFLLIDALSRMDSGELRIKTEPAALRRIVYPNGRRG